MGPTMANSKLILLEGIPGSGKSSAGAYIQSFLELQGVSAHFWREGDLDHPADFEGVACLSTPHYGDILARYPQLAALLQQHVTLRGVDCLVAYRKQGYTRLFGFPVPMREQIPTYGVGEGFIISTVILIVVFTQAKAFCGDRFNLPNWNWRLNRHESTDRSCPDAIACAFCGRCTFGLFICAQGDTGDFDHYCHPLDERLLALMADQS